MAITHFDARHISTSRDYQPQMTNWFEVQIEGISQDITLNAKSVQLPNITTDAVNLSYGNTSAKVAGQAAYAGGDMTIRDAILKDIEKQLLEWQAQVYNPKTGESGWVDEYKRTMLVTQYGPHGEAERVWEFYGVFPVGIDYGAMSMDGADAKEITLDLEYDRAVRKDF